MPDKLLIQTAPHPIPPTTLNEKEQESSRRAVFRSLSRSTEKNLPGIHLGHQGQLLFASINSHCNVSLSEQETS
ncbi:hypothetical protein scyTo_0003216 [Scyliorhinus torazame]|uniref:Uncharacterized protein n=1 Tax=Scyliorhinus torazame TaxID=75743 RepID=A0A401PLY1_SCYTO|nr:hypothetical protein [Scyliorhinus torazame]